jgi:hypothetical protein
MWQLLTEIVVVIGVCCMKALQMRSICCARLRGTQGNKHPSPAVISSHHLLLPWHLYLARTHIGLSCNLIALSNDHLYYCHLCEGRTGTHETFDLGFHIRRQSRRQSQARTSSGAVLSTEYRLQTSKNDPCKHSGMLSLTFTRIAALLMCSCYFLVTFYCCLLVVVG